VTSQGSGGTARAAAGGVPSLEHEIPLELIRQRPDLVRDLFRAAGFELPAGTTSTISTDLTEITSGPHFADCGVAIRESERIVCAVIVEVQRSRRRQALRFGLRTSPACARSCCAPSCSRPRRRWYLFEGKELGLEQGRVEAVVSLARTKRNPLPAIDEHPHSA
jgi:hypothetical protein